MRVVPRWIPGQVILRGRAVQVPKLFGLYPQTYRRTAPLLRLCAGPASVQDLVATLGDGFHRKSYVDTQDYILRRVVPCLQRDLPKVGLAVLKRGNQYVLAKSTGIVLAAASRGGAAHAQNTLTAPVRTRAITTVQAIGMVRREHVSAALESIDRDGIEDRNRSTAYCLTHRNRHYPPKEALRRASKEAGAPLGRAYGRPLFGGTQVNKPLERLGFRIERCASARRHDYPPGRPVGLPSEARGRSHPESHVSSRNRRGRSGAQRTPPGGTQIPPIADAYLRANQAALRYIVTKHKELAGKFRDWLIASGCDQEKITFEKSWVDLEFERDRQLCRAELKVRHGLSTTKAIREAIGQLLEYNFYGDREAADQWYIVLDSKPSERDAAWIEKMRSKLGMPLTLYWPSARGFVSCG